MKKRKPIILLLVLAWAIMSPFPSRVWADEAQEDEQLISDLEEHEKEVRAIYSEEKEAIDSLLQQRLREIEDNDLGEQAREKAFREADYKKDLFKSAFEQEMKYCKREKKEIYKSAGIKRHNLSDPVYVYIAEPGAKTCPFKKKTFSFRKKCRKIRCRK